MGNELVETGSSATTSIAKLEDELHLIATDSEQMQLAQTQLVEWFRAKIANCLRDAEDAAGNLEVAKREGWKLSSFYRQARVTRRRVEYYQKALAAAEAGYTLVPNFPIDIFAIRTTNQLPKRSTSQFADTQFPQWSEGPPAGEGETVNNFPFVDSRTITVRDKKSGERKKIAEYYPKEFDPDIEYPLSVAKPEVMNATAKALALKVFDEVGVLPERRRKGDPLVVGQILLKKGTYDEQRMSFLIAWYIDTRTL